MRVIGLFVGVDDQADENVRSLVYAANDAESLHAAFSDINTADAEGDLSDVVLLRGRDATLRAVQDAIEALVEKSRHASYGLAIVHFSCHGVPTGHLLLHDTYLGNLEATGLSFSKLASSIRKLRATQLVLSIDSCFSGNACGAVQKWEENADVEAQIEQFANGNRAVVTAAAPHERAWETPRHKHGLMSYGLLHGLYGTTQQGNQPVANWITNAVKITEDQAAREGRVQTPEVFFKSSGTSFIPHVPYGPARTALDARRAVHAITGDVRSLSSYGLPQIFLDALAARVGGGTLNDLQVRAVNSGGVLAGKSVVVAAPTSSGKTLIGELAYVAAHLQRRKSVVLLPTRALVDEKWTECKASYAAAGIRTVRSVGGVDDDDALLSKLHFDVAFLTYEKFLLLALTRPSLLDSIGVLVIDEVQMINEPGRGNTVELILTLFNWRRKQGIESQVVVLSAAIGDTSGLEEWLGATLVTETKRPTPLREAVISPSGRFRYRDSDGGIGEEQLIPAVAPLAPREWPRDARERVTSALIHHLLKQSVDERLLVFRAHKPDTRRFAIALTSKVNLPACSVAEGNDGAARDDSRATVQLAKCLAKGVGFHLADLEQHERAMIENAFRQGKLRCLVATSTLAMGINTPATTVILADHTRYDHSAHGERPYSVAEYRNMAGRAGRWTLAQRGTAFLVAADETEADDLFSEYVLGEPEALGSSFTEQPGADLTISLLTLRGSGTESELVELARHTFDGFINGADATWRANVRNIIRSSLEDLVAGGFVKEENAVYSATELGLVCGRESLCVESALRIMIAADDIIAAGEKLDERTLWSLAQLTAELDEIYMPVQAEDLDSWSHVASRNLFPDRPAIVSAMLSHGNAERQASRLKKIYAVARWLTATPMEQIERELSRFTPGEKAGEPLAGAVRQVAQRTGHVIRPVAKLIVLRHPALEEKLRVAAVDLRARLEFGVRGNTSALAQHRLGLVRAEIHRLGDLGIVDLDELSEAFAAQNPDVLAALGSMRAHQVAARVAAAKERERRAGQIDHAAQLALFADLGALDLS